MSIIGLPTKWIRRAGVPVATRLSTPFGARHEQEVRQEVRDPPVDLLGHRVVEGAEAGLDVGHRQADLGRHERRGNGRVDVAVHHRERRPDLPERPLEGDHDRGRLGGMRPGPDAEVEVRPRQVEVAEEDRGQRVVVVLAGVDEALVDAAGGERADDRRGLHEVGPGADDVCYGSSHVPSVRGAGVGLPAEPIPLSMGPG